MCTLPMFSVTFLDEKIDEHFEVLLWQCQGIQSRVSIAPHGLAKWPANQCPRATDAST